MRVVDFMMEATKRGASSLADHLNATAFVDVHDQKYMRQRVLSALKTDKWKHLAGTVIQNDGTRAGALAEHEVAVSNVPAPLRPQSIVVEPITAMLSTRNLSAGRLAKVEAGTAAIARHHSKRDQGKIGDALEAVVADADVKEAKLISRAEAAEQAANDLRAHLEEERKNSDFLRQMALAAVNGASNSASNGTAVARRG